MVWLTVGFGVIVLVYAAWAICAIGSMIDREEEEQVPGSEKWRAFFDGHNGHK